MTRNGNKRRRFPAKVKAEAARPLLTSGKPPAQLRKELGIPGVSWGNLQRGPIRNKDQSNSNSKGPQTEIGALQEEYLRLKQENEILRQQRGMLRKSLGAHSTHPLQKGVS
jgi:transposase-like protein